MAPPIGTGIAPRAKTWNYKDKNFALCLSSKMNWFN
uniref:Uncharacterized protein n=1 Tax=Anguilla anguilla TaxID=7936 RepID=A0A0E9RJH9_ANGAN